MNQVILSNQDQAFLVLGPFLAAVAAVFLAIVKDKTKTESDIYDYSAE